MQNHTDTEKLEKTEPAQRIDSLKARIKNNTGAIPLAVRSDKYTELDTQEIEEVTEAIAANTKISVVEVGVTVSENGAEKIMRAFLDNEYAHELIFNILGRVRHNSQWRLMRTQDDFEEKVDNHNYMQEHREQQSLLILAGLAMNRRKRQRMNEENLPSLPTELLRDKLKSVLTSPKKRIIAE
jgi:hypothetical protein